MQSISSTQTLRCIAVALLLGVGRSFFPPRLRVLPKHIGDHAVQRRPATRSSQYVYETRAGSTLAQLVGSERKGFQKRWQRRRKKSRVILLPGLALEGAVESITQVRRPRVCATKMNTAHTRHVFAIRQRAVYLVYPLTVANCG